MYQCQMGKQTMGTPGLTLGRRADTKMYKLQTPQRPLVTTKMYDASEMDTYPLGTNAMVAVICYTGYDMEDAMVINKGAFERGFAHGSVRKAVRVNLRLLIGAQGRKPRADAATSVFFARDPKKEDLVEFLDPDGLPFVGRCCQTGDPFYCHYDRNEEKYQITKYKMEPGYVESVAICGTDYLCGGGPGPSGIFHAVISVRIVRNPTPGDKFASRHGQKGVCSYLYPEQDMPFTASGMTPDIIFNPHGFPSRMTVGMLIESMAGKVAMSSGLKFDATPFTYNEDQPAIKYFGELLQKSGFNYYGNEPMYSGVDGREMEVQIFYGVVYYQRLRHMVSDKYQVRSTGPVDSKTHQPVQGRKMGGGIRFGEMERDALIAHGTSFLLHDRLMSCSDVDVMHVCKECGDLGSICYEMCRDSPKGPYGEDYRCRICGRAEGVKIVELPYVLRLLAAELCSVGIRLKLKIA